MMRRTSKNLLTVPEIFSNIKTMKTSDLIKRLKNFFAEKPKQNVEELFLTFPNRFTHRFEEPDLSQRQWELDNSFDDNLKSFIENEVIYYDGFDSLELFVRHWLYCSATAPLHETCFDCRLS